MYEFVLWEVTQTHTTTQQDFKKWHQDLNVPFNPEMSPEKVQKTEIMVVLIWLLKVILYF